MSSRAVEQPRRPAPRLLTVLAVLLGLLAMHGLASTHHAAAQPAAAATPHEHGSAATAAGQVSAARQPRTAAWALPGTSTGCPGAGAGTCDEHCPTDLALLCLAVLTAAAAFAGLARAARSAGTCAPRQHLRVRAPTRCRPLPPRIDPVAELCVSRT